MSGVGLVSPNFEPRKRIEGLGGGAAQGQVTAHGFGEAVLEGVGDQGVADGDFGEFGEGGDKGGEIQ